MLMVLETIAKVLTYIVMIVDVITICALPLVIIKEGEMKKR